MAQVTVSARRFGRRYGFVADHDDYVVRAYMDAVGSIKLLIPDGILWPEFYAWVRGQYWQPLKALFVLSADVVPYMLHLKERFGTRHHVELVSIGEVDSADFDRHLTYEQIGWGLDRRRWRTLGKGRKKLPRRKPVFYFSEPEPLLEGQIKDLGYKVVSGPKQAYNLGDVTVVPGARRIPYDIYESAATSVPVLSVRANAFWLSTVVGFDTYIEDGAEAMVRAVEEADYRFMGMMARDVVPTYTEFKARAKGILLGH